MDDESLQPNVSSGHLQAAAHLILHQASPTTALSAVSTDDSEILSATSPRSGSIDPSRHSPGINSSSPTSLSSPITTSASKILSTTESYLLRNELDKSRQENKAMQEQVRFWKRILEAYKPTQLEYHKDMQRKNAEIERQQETIETLEYEISARWRSRRAKRNVEEGRGTIDVERTHLDRESNLVRRPAFDPKSLTGLPEEAYGKFLYSDPTVRFKEMQFKLMLINAGLSLNRGELARSRHYAMQAQKLSKEVGNRFMLARTSYWIGRVQQCSGQFEEASQSYKSALACQGWYIEANLAAWRLQDVKQPMRRLEFKSRSIDFGVASEYLQTPSPTELDLMTNLDHFSRFAHDRYKHNLDLEIEEDNSVNITSRELSLEHFQSGLS